MRIAHLSDLHLLDLKGVEFHRFLNRRITGMVNLMTRRKDAHSAQIFERVLEDLLDQKVDHVVITGDLSNLALESEFERVAAYLRLLWDYRHVSVVPGNHDYYTGGARRTRRFEKTFYPYMFPEFSDLDVDLYPYAKDLGPVTIFGFCSPTETLPLFADGYVDPGQQMRFVRLVKAPKFRNTFKIALLHHHFHGAHNPLELTSVLRNRRQMRDLLLDNGVDLVLHGHDHKAYRGWLANTERRIPVIGAGSCTATAPDPDRVARYNIYTIARRRLEHTEVRRYDPKRRGFETV